MVVLANFLQLAQYLSIGRETQQVLSCIELHQVKIEKVAFPLLFQSVFNHPFGAALLRAHLIGISMAFLANAVAVVRQAGFAMPISCLWPLALINMATAALGR